MGGNCGPAGCKEKVKMIYIRVVRVGLTGLARVDLEPTRRTSVTVKFENVEEDPVVFFFKFQVGRQKGRVEVGLEDKQSCVSSA